MKIKKGNMTIECALIMPMILTVIISLVWLTIYLYDMSIAQTALIHGLLISDYSPNTTNSSLKEAIKAAIDEESAPYMVGVEECKVTTKVKQRKCIASMEIRMNITDSSPVLSKLMKNSMEFSSTRLSPAYVIRDTRKFKGMYDYYENLLKDHGLVDDGGYDGNELQEGSKQKLLSD